MVIAKRSCVRSEKFAFVLQIEKFSWHLRRGSYASSSSDSESTGCTWRLEIYDGKYIKIILRRENYKKENQSVHVHLTIVDSLNISPLYASKEIDFTKRFSKETILCVAKKEIFDGYFGINKVRFVPNDILTLKCEITSYEQVDEDYANDEGALEDTRNYVKNEIFQLLVLLFLIMAAFGLVCFAFLRFVMPLVRSFFSLSVYTFVITVVLFIGLLFLAFILLLKGINKLWHAINPGGDRTYGGSDKTWLTLLSGVCELFVARMELEFFKHRLSRPRSPTLLQYEKTEITKATFK